MEQNEVLCKVFNRCFFPEVYIVRGDGHHQRIVLRATPKRSRSRIIYSQGRGARPSWWGCADEERPIGKLPGEFRVLLRRGGVREVVHEVLPVDWCIFGRISLEERYLYDGVRPMVIACVYKKNGKSGLRETSCKWSSARS